MKRLIYIVIICLCGVAINSYAQTSLQELIDKMSDSDRKEYFDNARNYIENTYYNQLFATLSNRDAYTYVVEDLMAESNAQCKPEILCKGGEQRFLSPMEYMYCLGREFRDLNTDELEFEVSNIDFSPDILPYSTLSLRVWADYDLEVRYRSRTLLKRRCRMYCLFPRYHVVTRVRLLQVEPLKDLVAAQSVPAVAGLSDEERYNEAMQWYEQKQKDKYLTVFRELAEKGYTEAEWKYGSCLHDEKKFSEAVYWYRRAVKKNHAKAQNSLGYCYNYGEGVEKDLKQAVMWYRKSAEQGDTWGQCNLGICYYTGDGVAKNLQQAVHWFRKSAKQGNAAAQYVLAICYENGDGVSKDSQQAVYWYRKSAEQGNVRAQSNLGYCYYYGKGTPQNYAKAVEWYTKAAEQGDADAQSRLGYCYYYGKGTPQNYAKAVEWYRKSAEQGNATAQYNLGVCYANGYGVPKDSKQAVKWYTKAAEQGDADAQKALERLKTSVDSTTPANSSVSSNATTNPIIRYNQAVDAYKEGAYDIAYPIFKELAEQGYMNAQCYLGLCHQLGRGASKSDKRAIDWYAKAAGQGSADALYNLAAYYERGVCVIKDEEKAFDLYSRAAASGHMDAQYVLGLLYLRRIGVSDKDRYNKAKQWFQKAAHQGHSKAAKILEDVSYITKPSILYLEHLLTMARGKSYSEPSKVL